MFIVMLLLQYAIEICATFFKCDKTMFYFCPVQRMVELGKEILQKNNVTDLSDVRWVPVTVKTSA